MRPHKQLKISVLLEDPHVKRWHMNLARGSPVAAEVALRRIGALSGLLGLKPLEMVEKARSDLAGFQDLLEDSVAILESEGSKVKTSFLTTNNNGLVVVTSGCPRSI